MRLTAIHDESGNISKLVATATDGPDVRMELSPGERLTEIDAPEDRDLTDTEAIVEYLDDLIANCRVVPAKGAGATLERHGQ